MTKTIQQLCEANENFNALSIAVTKAFPESETLVFCGAGHVKESTSKSPEVLGHYQTQKWGELQDLASSTLKVGDVWTSEVTARTWQVLGNAVIEGDAETPDFINFVCVEVRND